MLKRTKKRRSSPRNGMLTVEVALCLPLIFLTLFGGYELAKTSMVLHASQSAAYEGARAGIIPGATPEKVEDAVGLVLRTMGVRTFQVETNPPVIARDTEQIEVIVRVPLRENLSLPSLFVQDPTFVGTCTLTREVP